MSWTTTGKHNRRLAALCCAGLSLQLLCSGCASRETAPPLLDTIQITPAYAQVERGDVFSMVTMQASFVPEIMELSFPISGMLAEVHVHPGDTVEEGDLLMQLDDAALEQKIENLQSEIESLKASYAITNRKIEIKIEKATLQLKQLEEQMAKEEETASSGETSSEVFSGEASSETETSSASEEETDSSSGGESAVESTVEETPTDVVEEKPRSTVDPYDVELKKVEIQGYKLELSQAQTMQSQNLAQKNKQLAEYREQQEDYRLYAPCNGEVVWLSQTADALADTGSRISSDSIVVILSVAGTSCLQTNRVDMLLMNKCDRMYAIANGKEYDIEALENDSQIDKLRVMEGKPLLTRFRLVTEDSTTCAGTALICLQYNTARDVLTVPVSCVFRDDAGHYVYRMDDNEREKVYVEIGMEGATRVEIVSGLEEGDLVYAKS